MKVKQSRNWWIEKDLKWILDNGICMFIKKYDNRPHIITKEKLEGTNSNCFKIDNDMYGILLNSHYEYTDFIESSIVKKTDLVKEHFQFYMKDWCDEEHFNPSEFSVWFSNMFRKTKRKDIILEIPEKYSVGQRL